MSAANENRKRLERIEARLWTLVPVAWASMLVIIPVAISVSLIRWAGGF